MATLSQSVQASCLKNTLSANTYTADKVINTDDTDLKNLNILTIDNVNDSGNCVSTIQANCFVPIMYDPSAAANTGYTYYGPYIHPTGDKKYSLIDQNNMYVTWMADDGTYRYTSSIPSTTTAISLYSDTSFATCVGSVSCTDYHLNHAVADCYGGNLKINEANIPYVSAELINHGRLPVSVIPTTSDLSSQADNNLPVTKGAILGSIQGMTRAVSYNNGILSLWGYGSNGCLYITSAVSLGTSTDPDGITNPIMAVNYPIDLGS